MFQQRIQKFGGGNISNRNIIIKEEEITPSQKESEISKENIEIIEEEVKQKKPTEKPLIKPSDVLKLGFRSFQGVNDTGKNNDKKITFDAKYAPEADTAKNMRAQFENLKQRNK